MAASADASRGLRDFAARRHSAQTTHIHNTSTRSASTRNMTRSLALLSLIATAADALRPSPAPGSIAYADAQSGALGTGAFLAADWRDCYVSVPGGGFRGAAPVARGALPPDLAGTLYRCSPGNFERGGVRYEHVLDGDGFMLKVDLRDGAATATGRFVETAPFVEERARDEILYRNTFGTQPAGGALKNFGDAKLKNVANTNCVAWGGRLLALWEAGAPHDVDPDSLETLGEAVDLAGAGSLRGVTLDGGALDEKIGMASAYTAHPHVDPNGGLVAFTWAQQPLTGEMRLEFSEKDERWNDARPRVRHAMPGCTLAPHDFGLTERYYVILENRMSMDLGAFALGLKGPAQALEMDLAKCSRLHLVPRDGSAATVVEIPPYFCIHVGAAFENDGKVTVLSSGWDLNDETEFPGGGSVPFLGAWSGPAPDFDNIPPTWLFETVVDADAGTVVRHGVLDQATHMCIEHPHHDPRTTRPRYVFASLCNGAGLATPPQGYARFDVAGAEPPVTWYAPGGRTFCEELVVVPKVDGPTDADVWLLGLAYDAAAATTSLLVLDGADLAAGPVATLPLPAALPHGLHGCYLDRNGR